MPYVKIANLKGPKGDTGTFASATATTLAPGSSATVAISGPENEKQVTFGIPRGAQGLPGTNAVPTDEAVAGYVGTLGESATKTALLGGFLARDLTRTVDDGQELIHIVDENPVANRDTFRLEDVAGHGGSIINIHHRSDGSVTPQTYGINIANHPGASTALVIHQYSDRPAMQIDNTDTGTALVIKNTENQTMNPGGSGTGSFLQFIPFGQTSSLQLLDSLTWLNSSAKDMRVWALNPSIYAFEVRTDADKSALQVTKNGTGAGNAAWVTNKGTGVGLMVSQDSTAGAGSAVQIVQKGTGSALRVQDAAGDIFRVHVTGELEQYKAGAGFVMRSASGARFKVSVSNAGALTVTAL